MNALNGGTETDTRCNTEPRPSVSLTVQLSMIFDEDAARRAQEEADRLARQEDAEAAEAEADKQRKR